MVSICEYASTQRSLPSSACPVPSACSYVISRTLLPVLRHARQRPEHDREVLGRQAHRARRRQELVRDRGRGQRDLEPTALLEREQQILLHHVDVEPCLSGRPRTNGPRYLTIGEAITLPSSTSTATSREIPPFSARRTPSLNATICTARLRFVAIFISTAWPLSPT